MFSLCIKIQRESDLVFPWIGNILLLNYLGQKVNKSTLTVTADSTFRPRLPFMYHKTKGIGFGVSLDQQNFTLEFFREKGKRIQTECNIRLHPSSCIKIPKESDSVFYWISNFLLLSYLGKSKRIETDCNNRFHLRTCLLFLYENSIGIGFSASMDNHSFTLQLFRAKKNWIQTDCNIRLHPPPKSYFNVSKIKSNRI